MASVAAISVRDRVSQALNSDHRLPVLSKLAWELVILNRGYYPPPDTAASRQLGASICVNEILHNLTSQIWSDLDHGRGGYPDQALVEGMLSKARVWHCEETCREAFRQAIERFTPQSATRAAYGMAEVLDPALMILASDHRLMFLTELLCQIADAALAIASPSLPELAPYIAGFGCINGLLVRVAWQLRADVSSTEASQVASEFIESLISAANSGLCGGDLRYAFERTLAVAAPT
jgi:hypothetical protein